MRAIAIVLVMLTACSLSTTGPRISRYDNPRAALIVLDMQRDFLAADGKLKVGEAQIPSLIATVNRLLDGLPGERVDVVYVANEFSPTDIIANWFRNYAAIRGTTGAKLDPRVEAGRGPTFTKSAPDAFSNSKLDAHLRQREVNHVVIVGVFATGCVKHTARGALNRGYQVTVVRDGVADRSAADVNQALATLSEDGARVLDSSAILQMPAGRDSSSSVR